MLCRVESLLNQDYFFNHYLRTDGFKPDVNVERDEDQRHPQQRQAFNLSYFFPLKNFTKTLQTSHNQLSMQQQANFLFLEILRQPRIG